MNPTWWFGQKRHWGSGRHPWKNSDTSRLCCERARTCARTGRFESSTPLPTTQTNVSVTFALFFKLLCFSKLLLLKLTIHQGQMCLFVAYWTKMFNDSDLYFAVLSSCCQQVWVVTEAQTEHSIIHHHEAVLGLIPHILHQVMTQNTDRARVNERN